MDTLITIIIPCHNAEATVAAAINSALSQTYGAIEVLVVDDGSTDGSLDVIRGFGEKVRCVTGPKHGAPSARNQGLEMAKGAYIQFLDADDTLHSEKLERQMAYACGSEADVVFCDGEKVNPKNGERLALCGLEEPIKDPVVYLVRHALLITAPLHQKQKLLEIGGFREDLPCSQERDLHIRLACAGVTFEHMFGVLFTVHQMANRVSSDYIRVLDQHANILGNAYRKLEENGTLSEDRARAFAARMAQDARHYIQRGCDEKGLEYFRQAIRMHRRGGLESFAWPYRMVYRLLGPVRAERMVDIKRIWRACHPSAKKKQRDVQFGK